MAHKLTIGVGWEGKPDFTGLIERSKVADEAGVIRSGWPRPGVPTPSRC